MNEKINVAIEPIHSIEQIKHKWNYIYSNSEENFFLSWAWINAWLETTLNKFDAYVCVAQIDDKPVGMALFVEVMACRYNILHTKQWWLHKTGNEKHDQPWIEHNDFLLNKTHASLVRESMWKAILAQHPTIDEFIIGLSHEETIKAHQRCLADYIKWEFIESKGWSTELKDWPDFDSYWMSRSKNFRHQINRTHKILEAKNASISINTDKLSFQQGLKTAEPWHSQNWGLDSGFKNDVFVKHFNLLSNATEAKLFTLSIMLDNKPIAVCLGFYTSTTLYFYLSAQHTLKDNKIKIGLYLHYQSIQWCYQNNLTCYDFLAGDYRYKRSFANKQSQFYLTHFQRNAFKFKLEKQLKLIKSKIVGYFKANSSPD